MSDKQKKPFADQAEERKEQYEKDLASWYEEHPKAKEEEKQAREEKKAHKKTSSKGKVKGKEEKKKTKHPQQRLLNQLKREVDLC